MHGLNKRDFLKRALLGSGALGLRSLVTGLPPAFLLYRRMANAQSTGQPTYLILSNSSAGHPINANVPGTYPENPDNANDPITRIDHARTADLGNGVIGTVNGTDFTAASFETPVEFTLGTTTVKAAGPWSALPQAMRNRMLFMHHRTYANAHPEFNNVMRFHGAVKGPTGTGSEMLSSFIAQETGPILQTLTNQPVNVGGGMVTFEGRPLGRLDPRELQSLFGGGTHPTQVPDPSQIVRLRDAMIDDIYRSVQASGSHAQRAFLDRYANGRSQAAQLGDALGPLLSDINGNGPVDEVRAAVALLQLNVTPVVVLTTPYGGDNHNDSDLGGEAAQTIQSMQTLSLLWDRLGAAGLRDRVTFANLDVFGRRLVRNSRGGRDHNRDHHAMMMMGPRIAPGVVGGLQPIMRNGSIRSFSATAIGDIPVDQTLESAGKTLAKAVGVPDDRINTRILGGAIVPSALA